MSSDAQLEEPNMRALLAIAISVGGLLSLHAPSDAREPRRRAQPPYAFTPPPTSPGLSERAACEDRAQNADPGGRYAGYPCWAREVFSRQPR
jgi:hypothetical protein